MDSPSKGENFPEDERSGHGAMELRSEDVDKKKKKQAGKREETYFLKMPRPAPVTMVELEKRMKKGKKNRAKSGSVCYPTTPK